MNGSWRKGTFRRDAARDLSLRPLPQPLPVSLLRQQPFGEIHALRQLPELMLHVLQLLQQLRQLAGVGPRAPQRRFGAPFAQRQSVGVTELTGDQEHEVVQPPEGETAEGPPARY